jgi:hypothetical protein
MYCADHDPITCAGAVQCLTCFAVGFPLDAEWIDPELLLVTYEAPCRHMKSLTEIVDPADITWTDLELAKYVRGRRCADRNARGRPCRSYARPGSDFCWMHQAQPQQRSA